MYLSPTYLTYPVLITISIYRLIPLPEDFCGVGHWVGLLCILTVHLMDEILGIALIKAIDWYIGGEPLTLIRHHL